MRTRLAATAGHQTPQTGHQRYEETKNFASESGLSLTRRLTLRNSTLLPFCSCAESGANLGRSGSSAPLGPTSSTSMAPDWTTSRSTSFRSFLGSTFGISQLSDTRRREPISLFPERLSTALLYQQEKLRVKSKMIDLLMGKHRSPQECAESSEQKWSYPMRPMRPILQVHSKPVYNPSKHPFIRAFNLSMDVLAALDASPSEILRENAYDAIG